MAPLPFEHLVAVGASSGGIEALVTLVAALPATFPAPICIVQHIAAESPGVLPRVLGQAGSLPVEGAVNGRRLVAGRVYVAPPDHHLLVEPGRLVVSRGPRENRFRPAIDPLFRSAAQVYGPRVIGVVLTGSLDDGTAGLWTIKQLGGVAIVQDPADAMFPSMPESASRHVSIDYSVRLAEIAPLLVRLASVPVHERSVEVPDRLEVEVDIAKGRDAHDAGVQRLGEPSPFACPECHGVLLEWKEANRSRFRCHTGHAYSAAGLLRAVNDAIEDALWNAIRAADEGGRLIEHLAGHGEGDDDGGGRSLAEGAEAARRTAARLRGIVDDRSAEAEPGGER